MAGARTTLGRIAERFGAPLPSPAGPIVRLFPTAERLADAPSDGFGMPVARADAIVAVARSVVGGSLDLSGSGELEPTLRALASIRGVGEWTTSYVAMRALRDPDAFPAGDLGVRHGSAALGLADDVASIRDRAERQAVAGLRGDTPGTPGVIDVGATSGCCATVRSRCCGRAPPSAMGDSMTWVALVWIAFAAPRPVLEARPSLRPAFRFMWRTPAVRVAR